MAAKKKALVISAMAGFIGTFLQNDIKILQSMGYEVHCAGNASNKDPEENRNSFEKMGTQFHQIDFSSKSPFSKSSVVSFNQVRRLLKTYRFSVVHCHTPIAGAIVRIAAVPYRIRGGVE